MVQGLLVLNYPEYEFERYHGTLLLYAVLAVGVIFNTVLATLLPMVESIILVLHTVGFFAIMIPLTVLAPHNSAHDVFATFSNNGAFKTQGLSFFVGIITSVFAFVGKQYDMCLAVVLELNILVLQVPMAQSTCARKSKMRQPLFRKP